METTKTKKGFFSKNLYIEMLRQTRAVAITLLVICLVITLCVITANMISWNSDKVYARQQGSAYNYSEVEVYDYCTDASLIAPVLTAYMFIGVFIIVLKAFSYQNKRADCDFYHAIPVSRTSLYLSTLAACLTWIVITVVATIALATLGCLVTGMRMPYADIPYALGTELCGALLVCAVTTLAVSITGVRFSNVVLFGILLLLPRFITMFGGVCMTALTQIVPLESYGFVFDPSYNIPVGLFVSPLMYIMSFSLSSTTLGTGMFYSLPSMLYTAVVALIYFVLAGFASNKRKSETAGSSASSKLLQHVYRCAIALPPLLILVALIMNHESDPTAFLVLITISLIVYFVFELISTRSVKKMLKSAPVYLAVVLFSVLFAVVVKVSATTELSKQYAAEDIRGISIQTNTDYYSSFYGSNYANYTDLLIDNEVFEDEKLIELAAQQWSDTITAVKKYNEGGERAWEYLSGETVTVKFYKNHGGSALRTLIFNSQTEYDAFKKQLMACTQYADAQKQLPSKDEIHHITMKSFGELSYEERLQLFEIYREEYAELSPEERSTLMMQSAQFTFYVSGQYNRKEFSSDYQISTSLTPNTMKKLVELASIDKSAISTTKQLMTDDITSIYCTSLKFFGELDPNAPIDDSEQYIYVPLGYEDPDNTNGEQMKKLLDIVLERGFASEITNRTVFVSIDSQSKLVSNSSSIQFFVTLTDEEYAALYETYMTGEDAYYEKEVCGF